LAFQELIETIVHVRLFVHVLIGVVGVVVVLDDPPQPPHPQPEFVCFIVSLIVAKYDR
jgi:hypothetical protein